MLRLHLNALKVAIFTRTLKRRPNYWFQTIVLEEDNIEVRNHVIEQAHQHGLYMRPIWKPLNLLPALRTVHQ